MGCKASAFEWAAPALAWGAGLMLLQQCARLPGPAEYAGLGLSLLAALGLAWRSYRRHARTLGMAWTCLAALVLAFAQGAGRAEQRLQQALPEAWEGRDVLLIGRVDSLPVATLGMAGAAGWRFEFAIEAAHAGPSAQDPALRLPSRLALSWYGEPGEAAPALGAGERWQLLARLRRPHGLMNPYAFDYELSLFERNLRASGVVRQAQTAKAASTAKPALLSLRLRAAPWWSLDAARQRLREALQRRLAEPGRAGILAALSLGDQAAISAADWALFRNTGVAHLLSVSGLHVTMFAWALQGLVGRLWRRSVWASTQVATPSAARWAGVLAALAYALFSGWGVPAQRTVWMLFSLAALRSQGLRWPWPLCLLASAVLVTAIDPWAIGQAGFWLSFAAVGLLMAGGSGEDSPSGLKAQLGAGLRSQGVATLGLAPLSLLFFQQVSLLGLAANLLAIPLVSFVITPLALAGALLPDLWHWAEACVQVLMAYLHWLDGFAWAVWSLPVAPWWAQIAGLCGGALLVLPLPWRLRALGPALLLPLLWPAPERPAAGEFELLAADVGQGTAVLLRTAGHTLLYDAGPQYAPGVDAGQRVLLPLLRALGVERLDVLLLSHRDSDHVGGAAAMLAGLKVAWLLSSLEADHPLLRLAPQQRPCERGQRWDWDGVHFEILHPLAADYGQDLKSNAMSCVLRVQAASGRAAMLTGDLEAAQETALLQREALGALRSEVLLVPHHGSKTSSTEAFLDAVAPATAVVQAGYRNRFGHPAPAVLARYQARAVNVLSSPDCGAWAWQSRSGAWSCQRQQGLRYWHRRPARIDQPQGPWPEGDVGF